MTGFVMLPNAILTHYVFYPKFNGNTMMVYAYLTKLSNDEYGYAWPSQVKVMSDLGISDTTFKAQVKTLEECGLIRKEANGSDVFSNNVYYVNEPIEDQAKFYVKFPEAKAECERKQATAVKVGSSRRKAREGLERKMDEKKAVVEAKSTQNDDEYSELDGWL